LLIVLLVGGENWLAKSKKVVAPSKWFGSGNSHLDTKDLYCSDWIVI
jgi:hypothetical protein